MEVSEEDGESGREPKKFFLFEDLVVEELFGRKEPLSAWDSSSDSFRGLEDDFEQDTLGQERRIERERGVGGGVVASDR